MQGAEEGSVHSHVRGKHAASLQTQRHLRPRWNVLGAAENRLASLRHRQYCLTLKGITGQNSCVYTQEGKRDRNFPRTGSVHEAGGAYIVAVSEQAELLGPVVAGHEAQQHQRGAPPPPVLSQVRLGTAQLPAGTVLHNMA